MKKLYFLITLVLLGASINQAQISNPHNKHVETFLDYHGTTRQIIEQVAASAGYKVRFLWKIESNETFSGTIRKNDSIFRILNWFNVYFNNYFAYSFTGDILTIDDYLKYRVDEKVGKPFIKTLYDSTRHGLVFFFENVSPVVVLDSILKATGRSEIIKVATSETVSGVIPLTIAEGKGIHHIFETHQWVWNKQGKTVTISPKLPEYEDINNSYNIDSSAISGSSYLIYTTRKRNDAKIISFKHLELQELFRILREHNHYSIDQATFFNKPVFVSGTLPLEMPLRTLIKLMVQRHHLFYQLINKTGVVFAECRDDLEHWQYN